MSYFKYTGYDASGQVVKESIEAENRDDAVAILQDRGIFVTKLSGKKAAPAARVRGGKIKGHDVVVFTRLLATMVNADIPIIDGLEIALGQVPEGPFRQVIRRLINDIQSGLSLSEALEVHPSVFSKLYTAMVKAGELSGKLGLILEQLFSFIERMENLKRKITTALIYPSIILLFSLGIVSMFLIVFIPQFKDNFKQFGDKLPGITKVVIAMSDLYKAYFLYAAGAAAAFFLFSMRFSRTRKGKRFFDKLKLKLPVAGSLIAKVILVRVTGTLGTLLSNGVPIIDALNIVAAASGNTLMEDLLLATKRRISDGERLAKTLGTSPLIPKMMLQMISMGEESGQLPQMLTKVGQFYDADVDVSVERLTSAITPVLIVGLGLFVAAIIIALFIPMFDLSKLVG